MNIDEVMTFVERVSHYDPARPQDLSRLRDEIISMAREADLWVAGQDLYQEQIERFAALVAAREREAIEKVCEAQKVKAASSQYAVSATVSAYNAPIDRCLAAIRARAEKETE